MSFSDVLDDISSKIDVWRGINEAQTRQVIILRMLQALGWDVWNPSIVSAEKNSGGGGGAYIPDFTIVLNDNNKFILEAKALGKEFTENDKTQAINYAGAIGLRWAVLSNGETWQFYDNSLYTRPAAERLSVSIGLRDAKADTYLKALLEPQVWRYSDAEKKVAKSVTEIQNDINRRQSLDQIAEKLRHVIGTIYMPSKAGLEGAIEKELDFNERELGLENLAELYQRLVGESAQSVTALSSPSKRTNLKKDPNLDITKMLLLGFGNVASQSVRGEGLQAWVSSHQLPAKNWRDIVGGLAETLILIGKKDTLGEQISLVDAPEAHHKTYWYRRLSGGVYVFVHHDKEKNLEIASKLLALLDLAPSTIKIEYKGNQYTLP